MAVFDAKDEACLRGAKERRQTHVLIDLLDPAKNRLFVADVLAALGEIHDHPAVAPAIATYLGTDPRPAVQSAGIRSLARLGDERAAESLRAILTGTNRRLRYVALKAFAKIGGPSSIAVLRDTLSGASRTLRSEMLTALGRIGGPDALELLREQMASRDPVERVLVADSLGSIGGDEAVTLLGALARDRWVHVKIRAVKALSTVGNPAAERALEQLRNESQPRWWRWFLSRRLKRLRTAQTHLHNRCGAQ